MEEKKDRARGKKKYNTLPFLKINVECSDSEEKE